MTAGLIITTDPNSPPLPLRGVQMSNQVDKPVCASRLRNACAKFDPFYKSCYSFTFRLALCLINAVMAMS